ncbi:BamA/TamA family outer membrane protein [Burkholderiaceae bacterium FT117]|uniref:autotransporter assembly complex protein TamA n=1 Tax=Zeimonas sediminis TaxID=2944268 RepID=UPI002342CC4F|nr:BamA/TamA family outer membrane protein [Zeimonas sediminis]MCM5570551.1 BamA/TamA family outer membrane protein [Zeimonas sediminis]
MRAGNYRLEIEAPAELVGPIRERTLLGRWVAEKGFEREQLPLFVIRGREEAAAIVRDAGYFSAQVEVKVDPPEAAEPAAVLAPEPPPAGAPLPTVTIVVDAGARTTVSRLDLGFAGLDGVEDLREALRDSWPLPEGSFFRPSVWEQGKRLMLEMLQQRGFVRAKVADSRAQVDVQATAASLSLAIEAGPRLPFGPLEVRGLERYDRSIVDALKPWHEAGPGRAGDPYDFDELLLFQARLRGSGYFFGADVLPDLAAVEADPSLEQVPIVAVLRERRRKRVTLGMGYSSDEGPRALVGYEHRDLFGRNLQLESGLLWQDVRRRAFASVRTPQREDGYFDQVGARVERLEVQGELTDRQTLLVGRGKRGEEIDHFVSLQYQTEQRTVPLDPETDRREALTLGYSWNLRRVDSQVDPRSGYTISAQVSGGARELLSDRSFVRAWARAMRFWPMPEDSAFDGGLLVGLVEAGEVFASSREGIPTENLFRTGGTHTVRGYSYLSLGVPEGGAIVGGRVMALGSLEYQHPLARDWYGAAFVDVGNAVDSWGDWEPAWGTGVGVGWRSPVGPVNLYLAWADQSRRFRFHLSVGYAF